MPKTLDDVMMTQSPTALRPLLGTLILVVEDSRHACEALRLICQRSGARIRRAESLASAQRHLCTYRPRIAVVDLGLPDGSGLELIERLAQSDPRIEGLIATSGDETLKEAALTAGADIFLPKPLASVSQFQQAALSLLPNSKLTPKPVSVDNDTVSPDPIALRDDLSLAADLLRQSPDKATLAYVTGFLSGLGKSAENPRLADLAKRIEQMSETQLQSNALSDIALKIEEEAAAFELV